MNLRTLKKLSKRAAALLPLLGDDRKQFPAEREDSYTGLIIRARKHWERSPCHPGHQPRDKHDIKVRTRAGRTIVMRHPNHPRKGTVMVGAMSGYYEPEWDEETAYEALLKIVYVEFTDWSEHGACPLERDLSTPRLVFRAAYDLIAQREHRAH